MNDLVIRPYRPSDEAAVINVWAECGLLHPENNPKLDIERKMRVNPELFLVGEIGEQIVATCMVGYEGHRGWINYLGVLPSFQRQGIASQIMLEAESRLRALGCPKINLQVRGTNAKVVQFYESLGYANNQCIGMGKRLVQDEP